MILLANETFRVEWNVTCAFFLMSFDGILPSQQPSQAHSCRVGASPCGCLGAGSDAFGSRSGALRVRSISRIRQQSPLWSPAVPLTLIFLMSSKNMLLHPTKKRLPTTRNSIPGGIESVVSPVIPMGIRRQCSTRRFNNSINRPVW